MDFRLKPCRSSGNTTTSTFQHMNVENNGSNLHLQVDVHVDRLSSLPPELLIRILSFLPTKDAAATRVLSTRFCRVFPLISALDFDATHICHCSKHPSQIQHLPSFVNFVDTVLSAHQSQYLTRFILRVGVDLFSRYLWGCNDDLVNCFPDLKSSQINAWISFPLTHYGLTELDIRIQIKEPGDAQLPPEIFTCETLEQLKLDVNLGFHLVSSFRLPKLKLCHIYLLLISEDDFLTKLVSSCPLLEDFAVEAYCNRRVNCASFTSASLRRLHLKFCYPFGVNDANGLLINAPNLEHLYYYDNLALQYSVQNMPGLVDAVVCIPNMLMYDPSVPFNQQVFNLIRPLSNVQHLSLFGQCTMALHYADVKADQLPVFPNLKCLELGFHISSYWDRVLVAFLNCSPVLETIVFPEGLAFITKYGIRMKRLVELEQEDFRRPRDIVPQCCRAHLKRIVVKRYFGLEREVGLIQFLLRQAYVLQELVVFRCLTTRYPVPDPASIETTLKNLPRASETCSIHVI